MFNSLLGKLLIELHIKGYQYCGKFIFWKIKDFFTHHKYLQVLEISERLARGEKRINPLDSACQEHDIAYSKSKDLKDRHAADRILVQKAKNRIFSKDPSFGEKVAAASVYSIIGLKEKIGMGAKKVTRKRRRVAESY